MFLKKHELQTVAPEEVIDRITEQREDIVTQIIAESIDRMKTYLQGYYDTQAVFSAQGNQRSLVVLKYLKDIVIHEVYIRRTHRYNEVAKMHYDEALLWLEKVAKGMIDLNLPKKKEATEGQEPIEARKTEFIRWGSKRKYKTSWR